MIQRKLDELGRIVLPMEVQTQIGVAAGCAMTMSVQDGMVVLVPTTRCCSGCGAIAPTLHAVVGMRLCDSCVGAVKNL